MHIIVIEQTDFLNVEKRFKNNDFRAFFEKKMENLTTKREKLEKYDFYHNDFFKYYSY